MKVYLFLISFLFVSCDFIENKPDKVLARLGDEFYYTSDLIEVFPTGLNEEDSVIFVKNRIDDWAKEKLLFKKALVNLGDEKQENLNQLIESYKNELFSYAYQEKIVKSAIDTFISLESVREYYNLNKLNFKLNQEIINARYLKINSENYNLKDVVKRFRRFKQSDKIFLDSISLQFSSYYFNDSLWINKDVFFNKIPEINDRLKQNIVKNKLFYRLQDSLELYLINIKDYKLKNDIAPFDYIKSTLKQVLLNKKKLEFISKFENEIIEDALQQNELEFYETN